MFSKVITLSAICILVLFGVTMGSENQKSFIEVEEKLWELVGDSLYDEVISLLDSVGADYSDNDFEISDWYTTIYVETKQYDKAYKIWAEGHEKGYFYLLHPRLPAYKDIAETEEFKKLSETDLAFRATAMEQSKSIKEIVLPDNYDKSKKYPLLVALHGGGSTIERAKSHWHSEKLSSEFIVMFLQSYRHYNMKKFGWGGGDERAREDIRSLFSEIVTEYNIDTTQVIISGMSAGGFMAVDIAVNNVIPLAGFFGVCPGEPAKLNIETATRMKDACLKGYIVAGETDFYRERQDKMMKIFDEAEFPYEFHEIKGMGHEYPDNFESWIDLGLKYILES